MSDPRFVTAFSHLAPAVIRVGGITADWAYYEGFDQPHHPARIVDRDEEDTARSKRVITLTRSARSTARVRTRGYWPTSEFNLTFATFMQLHDFAAASGLSLMFDLNELHGERANLFAVHRAHIIHYIWPIADRDRMCTRVFTCSVFRSDSHLHRSAP